MFSPGGNAGRRQELVHSLPKASILRQEPSYRTNAQTFRNPPALGIPSRALRTASGK
jgi:hypothetical protein